MRVQRHSRSAWLVMATLMCGLAVTGCKKDGGAAAVTDGGARPVSPGGDGGTGSTPPSTADAGAAAPSRPLTYEDVKLSYARGKLTLSFKVTHGGPKRRRGLNCLDLYDEKGEFIAKQKVSFHSVGPGDWDEVEDERVDLQAIYWEQAHTLVLYPSSKEYCEDAGLAEPTLLDKSGQVLAPGSRVLRDKSGKTPQPGSLELSEVSLRQSGTGEVSVAYRLTNTNAFRVSSNLCVRLYAEAGDSTIDEDSTPVTLSGGESKELSFAPRMNDDLDWDRTARLKLFVGQFGCSDSEEEAHSNVFELDKPPDIKVAPFREPEAEPEAE